MIEAEENEGEVHISDGSVFTADLRRATWSNKIEFVLAIMGYVIGIGNVWRYPYLCYRNGGGAFVTVYLLMVLIIGFPLFYMEACLGQFLSTGCISMFRICPLLKGAGFATVLNNMHLICYYVVVISYSVLFLIEMMRPTIPWKSCNNSWNTPRCMNIEEKQTVTNESFLSPSDEFFHYQIVKISQGMEEIGNIQWPLFGCLLFSWIFLYLCVRRGIKSIGKVVYFTSLFPVAVMLILFVRGVTLDGAVDGMIYYLNPDFQRLGDLRVWADAASQVFISIGPGWGGIVSMASFNNLHNNAFNDAILIVCLNVILSIIAGFVVFTVLGFLSKNTGITIDKVATQGPSLVFVTYPEALVRFPIPHLWSAIFFLMLFVLGMSTLFVQVEAIIRACIDEYTFLRPYSNWVTFGAILGMFSISIGMVTNAGLYILSLIDTYVINLTVICICLVEVIIVGWIYGTARFSEDIYFMMHKKPSKILIFCWKYLTPLVLVFIGITTVALSKPVEVHDYELPSWSIMIALVICAFSVSLIPVYAVFKIFKKPTVYKERFKLYASPRNWCPADEADCQRYNRYKARSRSLT